MKNKKLLIVNYKLLIIFTLLLIPLTLFLSCTKPNPKNPFDPQVSPADWAPTNLQYEVLNVTSVKLSWKDNCELEDGFIIERKVNDENWTQLAQVNENITQYTDNNATAGANLKYRIYAFAGSNNSSYSNEIVYTSIEEITLVQGGTFDMGDHYNEGGSDELPVHSVTLANFAISKTEVTHTRYIEFLNDFGVNSNGSYNGTELIDMDDSDCAIDHNGSFYFGGSNYASSADCPVIEVTWYGCVVYCNWKSQQDGLTSCYNLSDWSCDFDANGYRLPTEAEWEYAARGGINWEDNYKYSGTTDNLGDYAWYYSNSNYQTHPVGTKLPNQLGIFDMSGNVWEWCNDWYDSGYYSSSPQNNPTGPENGSYRVLRGGSWFGSDFFCRVASRNSNSPSSSYYYFGFRFANTFIQPESVYLSNIQSEQKESPVWYPVSISH